MSVGDNVFRSAYAIGDKVSIDGCSELGAVVTAVLWRRENPSFEVSWIDGSARTAWIEEWRLKPV